MYRMQYCTVYAVRYMPGKESMSAHPRRAGRTAPRQPPYTAVPGRGRREGDLPQCAESELVSCGIQRGVSPVTVEPNAAGRCTPGRGSKLSTRDAGL